MLKNEYSINSSTFLGKKYFFLHNVEKLIEEMFDKLTHEHLKHAIEQAHEHHARQSKRLSLVGANVIGTSGFFAAPLTFGASLLLTAGGISYFLAVAKKDRMYTTNVRGRCATEDCYQILEAFLKTTETSDDEVSHKAFLMYYLLEPYLSEECKEKPDMWNKKQRVKAICYAKEKFSLRTARAEIELRPLTIPK